MIRQERVVINDIKPRLECGAFFIKRVVGEQVQVLNLNNGERFITYTIHAPRGSGTVMLNGPAARLGVVGDRILVISYCALGDDDAKRHTAKVIHVDECNRLKNG